MFLPDWNTWHRRSLGGMAAERAPPAGTPPEPSIPEFIPLAARSIFYEPSPGLAEGVVEYTKMAYCDGAKTISWRKPTVMTLTRVGELPIIRKKNVPGLFVSVPIGSLPDDLINPPGLSLRERKAATRAMNARSPEEIAAEVCAKLHEDREVAVLNVQVQLGREALNFCKGLEIELSVEQLRLVNEAIKVVYPDGGLTEAEGMTWIFHERALVGDVLKHYKVNLAAYAKCALPPPTPPWARAHCAASCARGSLILPAPCSSGGTATSSTWCASPTPSTTRSSRVICGALRRL